MADTEFILIKISDAPGLLPSGFTEEIYTQGRTKRMDTYDEKLITDEKFTTRKGKTEQQEVQLISYDKYELVLLKKESHNIELIKQAQKIVIYDYTDNTEHHAQILNYTQEQVPGSNNQKVTIEYYDNNSYNYYNGGNVINILRSDAIETRLSTSERARINIIPTTDPPINPYNYYTAFISEQFTETENIIESELNGKVITSRITLKTKRKLMLYLSESDAAELKYYGELSNNYTNTMRFYEASTYVCLERPLIEITKEPQGVDLWKAIVTITTAINNELIYS